MVWSREAASGVFDTPERRAELEARLKQVTNTIGDESVRRHYGQDMRERLAAFFDTGTGPSRNDRGRGFGRTGERGFRGEQGGRYGGNQRGGLAGRRYAVSERLTRSGLVRGHAQLPALRESVLTLTVVSHPRLLHDEFDEIVALEFDNRDLARLWTAVLELAGEESEPASEALAAALRQAGFGDLLDLVDQQVRNARIWTATAAAAPEDARDGFRQALALHKRTRALRWQKAELERDIAEATEAGDAESVPHLIRTLNEVQLEERRLENQEAIIDGFGVLSGRAKGAAGA
jgi:DNA primase